MEQNWGSDAPGPAIAGDIPTNSEIRRAVDAARAAASERSNTTRLDAASGPTTSARLLQQLQDSQAQIEALGFRASGNSIDGTISAFEAFSRSVTKAAAHRSSVAEAGGGGDSNNNNLLDELEPKQQILEFLLDVNKQSRKHQSRVAALLRRLLASDGWRRAAKADCTLQARIEDLVVNIDGPCRSLSRQTSTASSFPMKSASVDDKTLLRRNDEDRWVTWFSVDPRCSQLVPYPVKVMQFLEATWHKGDDSVQLGDMFFGATITFKPQMQQITSRGSRDVLRVELTAPTDTVVVHVTKGQDWRLATSKTEHPGSEARRLETSPDTVLKLDGLAHVGAFEPLQQSNAPVSTCEAVRRWVVWVSIEPRKGTLQFYPLEVARKLEAAWSKGDSAADLGQQFHGAQVQLRPKLIQRTATGSRDVLRLQLDDPLGPAIAQVAKKADWRAAPEACTSGSEERRAIVPFDMAIEINAGARMMPVVSE